MQVVSISEGMLLILLRQAQVSLFLSRSYFDVFMFSISFWNSWLNISSSVLLVRIARSFISLSVLPPNMTLDREISTQKSILAQTMQWMGFSGRERMVQTGNCFWLLLLGQQEQHRDIPRIMVVTLPLQAMVPASMMGISSRTPIRFTQFLASMLSRAMMMKLNCLKKDISSSLIFL